MCALAVACLLFPSGAAAAGRLTVSGLYGYEEDGNGRLLEFYNSSANLFLDQPLTPAARLSENVRYGLRYKERGASREELSPSAGLSVTNDIFSSRLAVSRRESRIKDRFTDVSTSLQADMGSAWKNRWLPTLHVGFGSDRDYTDTEPRTADRQKDRLNSSIGWSYGGASVFYDYSVTRDRDYVRNSDNELVSHLARFNGTRSLWGNRLMLSLSHSYSLDINDNVNLASASGLVLRKLVVSQALSGVDTTPLTGTLANNPGLNDGNTSGAALSIAVPGQGYNIAAKVDLQEVDFLYIYTTADLGSLVSSFNWRLYSSSDGTNWTQESLNTSSVTYDAANLRFVVPVGSVSAVYVKVVVDYSLAWPLPSFAEIEAYDASTAPPGTTVKDTLDITTNQTNFSLAWRILPDLRLTYNLGLYKKEYDPGRDSETRNHTADLNYSPNRYLDATLSAGDNWRQESGELENTTRVYGLSLGSAPLDTVDLHGGGTYTENRRGEVLINEIYHYDSDITARLYPDLSALYSVSHDTTKTAGTGATSKVFKQTLEFSAYLTPELATTLSGTQSDSKSDTTKTTTYTAALNIAWHPGDILSVSLSGTRQWNPDYIESQIFSATVNTKTSANSQLDLRYTLTKKEETSHSGSVSFRWNLLHWLTWENLGSYNSTKDNEFLLKSTLSANFSTY